MKKILACFFLVHLVLSVARAGDDTPVLVAPEYRIDVRNDEHRLKVDFFYEGSQFTRNGVNFQGGGLGAGVRYGLSEKTAVGFSASQTYSSSGGFSALYTGLQIDFNYSFRGSFIRTDQATLIDGEKVLQTNASSNGDWGLFVGTEQVFFNGTDTVIPGTGLTIGPFVDFDFAGLSWTAKAAPALLLVNGKTATCVVGRIGLTFPF